MKKWLILLVFLLVGCSEEEVTMQIDSNFYEVYLPFKENVGNYSLESYDKENVEYLLMNLSMKIFKTNSSYYQEGQYLTKDELIDLLSIDKLNKTDIEYQPKYIKAIYEQNYLSSDGNLKGISLAIILDKEQQYIENDKIATEEIDDKVLIEHAEKIVPDLLNVLRNKIDDQQILVALYIDRDDGNFVSYGITDNNKIKFESINYHFESLTGTYVTNNDITNYNTYMALNESIKDFNVYISTNALYEGNDILNLDININTNLLSRGELLYLTNTISKNLKFNCSTKVYIKYNNQIKALLTKDLNSLEVKIHLL